MTENTKYCSTFRERKTLPDAFRTKSGRNVVLDETSNAGTSLSHDFFGIKQIARLRMFPVASFIFSKH
jgi:hypothetical protein